MNNHTFKVTRQQNEARTACFKSKGKAGDVTQWQSTCPMCKAPGSGMFEIYSFGGINVWFAIM